MNHHECVFPCSSSVRIDLKQNLGNSEQEEKLKFLPDCEQLMQYSKSECSKNQNKVLKCIFKSSWVLGFAKYWGLCKKKIPHGWGNTRTLKCTIRKVPTSARGPPRRGNR